MKRIAECSNLMTEGVQCALYNQSLVDSYELKEYVKLYKKYLNITSGNLVDLGSGSCNFVIALCLEFPDITIDCYEQSKEMIRIAKENIQKYNLTDRISIIEDDLLNALGTYDGVLLNRVLHHIDDTEKLWKVVNGLSSRVFAVDLERPEDMDTINGLLEIMNGLFDPIFINDTVRSFKASYTRDEVRAQVDSYGYTVEVDSNSPNNYTTYSKVIISNLPN